ncbi:MAG: cell wall-binding repeat-containing protein, partial [Candidatus Aenigmatarchaeota archaeon]
MKISKTVLGLTLALALVSVPVLAADSVDKVILASSVNNPDAMVATSVSHKLGVPILFTDGDELSEETRSALRDLDPSEVVVVGGPAVVSEDVVNEVKNLGYSTTWLWGMTRYGTAEEITTRFWPEGAEEAVLVENRRGERNLNALAASTNLVKDSPILPISQGEIPAVILNQLKELNVERVTVIGTEVTEEMESNLSSLGIQIQERIQAKNETRLKEKIEEKAMDDLESNTTLMVVASSAASQAVSSVNVPGSQSLLVSSRKDVLEIVDVIKEKGIQTVRVVGRPDLARKVVGTLTNRTDATVELVSGQGVAAQAAAIARKNRPEFARKFKRSYGKWQQQLQKKQQIVKKRANQTLSKVKGLMDDFNATETEEYREALQAYRQGNYNDALEKAMEARQEMRGRRWQR